MENTAYYKDDFHISTDKNKLDLPFIHSYLSSHTYWAKGIPLDVVQRSIENALCFGVYKHEQQVGFARVITDFATIAYLGDVFITEEYRGIGLSKWLMQCVVEHPALQGLRRWILLTSDAHGLYEKVGFKPVAKPEVYMERHFPGLYDKVNQCPESPLNEGVSGA